MGNLEGWNSDNKLALYIDNTNVDTDLYNFPVRLHLSTGSGKSNKDLSYIFDEVGANSKKIAVTTADGVTQTFVEIEHWDDILEEAELWVTIPEVLSTSETLLYLYYDGTQPDNDILPTISGANDNFTGTNGAVLDITKWRLITSSTNYDYEILSNKAHIYPIETSKSVYTDSKFSLIGDFDIQIDFEDVQDVSAGYTGSLLRVTTVDGTGYLMDVRHYFSSNKRYGYYWENSGGSGNGDLLASTSDTSGKLRLVRVGSDITPYYWTGSAWTPGSATSKTISDQPLQIKFGVFNSSGVAEYNFDNFIINSAGSVTAFVGDIGEFPAKQVWDKNFVAVYHLNTMTDYDIDDAFDDNKTNTLLWSVSGNAESIREEAGVLNAHNATEDYNNKYTSTYTLSGDFDIQVDFNNLNIVSGSTSATARFLFWMDSDDYISFGIIKIVSGSHYYRTIINIGGSSTDQADYVADYSGKFRITRVGSVFTSYRWTTTWVQCKTRSGVSTADGEIQIGSVSSSLEMDVDFNNYIVNSVDTINIGSKIIDSTSNNNEGLTDTSMTTADLVDGQIGDSLDFDGTDDNINIADNSSLQMTNSMTLEGVINHDSIGNTALQRQIIFKIGDDTHRGYDFYYVKDTQQELNFRVASDSTTLVTHAVNISDIDGSFSCVAGVYDATAQEMKVYLDSVEQGTTKTSGVPSTQYSDNGIDVKLGSGFGFFDGKIDETRISNVSRSAEWLKATHYSNFDSIVSFEAPLLTFLFDYASPSLNEKSYGLIQDLSLIVTLSGIESSYSYDTSFYTGLGSQIGTTISGTPSGQSVTIPFSTLSGTTYDWYITATSSGTINTSSTYDFYVRYLCSGICEVTGVPASGIDVRLYKRNTGLLVDSTTSAGTGTFSIDTPYNEEHYAIALHDDADLNALIYDKIKPE